MPTTAVLHLPGVYFLPSPPPASLGLPRLDVAAFVGFAERGPLHRPVAVEDIKTYRAIFGDDLALARESSGATVFANLPTAVAAFFENGGRRAYVVRVAGEGATATRFRLPAVVALSSTRAPQLAPLSASSPGRWGGQLRLATLLQSTPLPVGAFRVEGPQRVAWQNGSAPQAIQVGDLLQLTFEDKEQWLFPVSNVREEVEQTSEVTLEAQSIWRLVSTVDASPPQTVLSISRLTCEGPAALDLSGMLAGSDKGLSLAVSGQDAKKLQPGDVLLLELDDGATYLLSSAEIGLPALSSPASASVTIGAAAMLCLAQPASLPDLTATSPPFALSRVERLRFDLFLEAGHERLPTLVDLAFNAGHPLFWGEMIVRQTSASDSSGRAANEAANLTQGLNQPGQVAGPTDAEQAATGGQPGQDDAQEAGALGALFSPVDQAQQWTYLPLGMPAILNASDFIGPDPNEVGKDDLDTFDLASTRLFLDDRLAPYTGQALVTEAFSRYFVQHESPRGLHSLMFNDEVALVCAPDGVHRNWCPADKVTAPDAPPAEKPVPVDPLCPPPGPFVDCQSPPTVSTVNPDRGPTDGGIRVTVIGTFFAPGGGTIVTFGGSPATDVQVIDPTRLTCVVPGSSLAGPVIVAVATVDGAGSLADGFIYQTPAGQPALPNATPAECYDLEQGPLLAIQQALVHFCQARGNIVGILSLPQHFQKRECIGWQQTLRQKLGLPRQGSVFDEVRDLADLSYVAVYHPWLVITETDGQGQPRLAPGEGAVCGMIAARERARQVWVAPANVPLRGVLGLAPSISRDDWAELFDLQFNLVRAEPKDFRTMSAHTLSDEQSLLQVSVRRLMILLRKVAIERGMDFVFESNHEQFRDGVRAALEAMLQFFFEGGAFSAPTPQTAYRVVTDERVNPPESVELGRFIAQIQVAPSQPMEFITVLLTRTGEGALQAVEA